MKGTPTSDPEASGIGEAVGSVDARHLLLVGAGPGLGLAVARGLAERPHPELQMAVGPGLLLDGEDLRELASRVSNSTSLAQRRPGSS